VISTKYSWKIEIEQAIHSLESLLPLDDQLDPFSKLRLAWECKVEKWHEECLADILSFPPEPEQLTLEDMKNLEPELTAAVLDILFQCNSHRLSLTLRTFEARHDASCLDGDRDLCNRSWQIVYSGAVLLFNSSCQFYTGREVYAEMKGISAPLLNNRCKNRTFVALEADGCLWKEEEIVKAGCESLKKVLLETRPAFPRPESRIIPPDASE
jgi:hypothetical protein